MIVRKCDRCGVTYGSEACGRVYGKVVASYKLHVYTQSESLYGNQDCIRGGSQDLCPECYRELLEWFIEPDEDKYSVEMNEHNRWTIKTKEETI